MPKEGKVEVKKVKGKQYTIIKPAEDRINACFKGNDLRCIYGKSGLDEDIIYRTGRALVTYLKAKEVIVGRDMRVSSSSLHKALVKGILDQGANVIDLGLVDTPYVYFASGYLKKPATIITASHNPAEYNGVKIVKAGVHPVDENTGLKQIKELVISKQFPRVKARGRQRHKSLDAAYRKHVLSFIDTKTLRPIKVVVDAGNGMGGKMVPIVYKGLPIKIIPLGFRLDGTFPMHTANPAKSENLKHLQENVKKHKADFGMAFDADMDRVFFIDEKGGIINSSITAALIIKHFLSQKICTNVIYSLIVSKIVPETLKKYCGKPIRSKVGHSFIKGKMRQKNALFAMERSGHFYYGANFYADSALITSVILCEIFSKHEEPLSQLVEEFQKYYDLEEQSVDVKDKEGALKRVEAKYKKRAKKVDHLDGLTMTFKNFWFNVRISQTEDLLRVNIESKDKKIVDRESKELLSFIKKSK